MMVIMMMMIIATTTTMMMMMVSADQAVAVFLIAKRSRNMQSVSQERICLDNVTYCPTGVMMTIMIALNGANQIFYNLLTTPRTVSNTNALVARAQSCANHVQHIERLSRAACRVPRDTKGQLSYLV